MVDGFPELSESENKLADRMIKQLSNPVIVKYRDLSGSYRFIFCLSLAIGFRQIIDLLTTLKIRLDILRVPPV